MLAFLLACGAPPDDSAATDPNDAGRPSSVDDSDPEGEEWEDEPPEEDPPDSDPPEGEHVYSCAAVGDADGPDGFFTLRSFGDYVYAGEFAYNRESVSMLYRHSPFERVSPGLTGISESVCALLEFDGQLYANTESSGDIFRSSDGATWERVWDGESGTIGCGLEVFDGALYAVNYNNQDRRAGQILKSTDGASWSTVWSSGEGAIYLRHLVAHDGRLHALATDEDAATGYDLWSDDGGTWTPEITPTRFFRGVSWNGALYLSSTTSNSNGPAGIWTGTNLAWSQVLDVDDTYVTELAAWDDALWAGTSDGWKEATGESRLLMSRDGSSWEEVCRFDEAAAWSVAPHGDHRYVGTWEYGHGGRVYEVSWSVQ